MTATDRQRLDRIERALAQIASALQVAVGCSARADNQHELAEILAEAQTAVHLERRPQAAPERVEVPA